MSSINTIQLQLRSTRVLAVSFVPFVLTELKHICCTLLMGTTSFRYRFSFRAFGSIYQHGYAESFYLADDDYWLTMI